METPRSTSGFGGASGDKTLFVDTSLDTHLAISVSDSDTVFDVKKKILDEHLLLFPNIGRIEIHSLKVKRKGHFYHLSDSLPVKSAFDGFSKSWFLFLDASSQMNQGDNQHSRKPDSKELEPRVCLTNYPSADVIGLLPDDPSKRQSSADDSRLLEVQTEQHAKQKPYTDLIDDNICSQMPHDMGLRDTPDIVSQKATETHNSGIGISSAQISVLLEGPSKTKSVVKKKRKSKRRNEDEAHHPAAEENKTSAHVSDKGAFVEDAVVPDKSLVGKDGGTLVTHNIEVEVKEIANGCCKAPDNEVEMTDVQNEGKGMTEERAKFEKIDSKKEIVDAQGNLSAEETLPATVSHMKRRTVRKNDNGNSSKVKRGLKCDSAKEILQNNDAKAMALAKCTSSDKDEVNLNSKEANVSSNLLNAKTTEEPGKSPNKRKKSKKTQDQDAVAQANPGAQNTTFSVPSISSAQNIVHNDCLSNKSKKEESVVVTTDKEGVAVTETVKTSALATDRDTDNVIRDVLEAVQNMNNPANAESKDEKLKKKPKRKRNAIAKSFPELQNDNENVSGKKTMQSNDGLREVEVDASSKPAKKIKLAEASSKHQSKELSLEWHNEALVEKNSLDIQLNSDIVKSSQVSMHEPEGGIEIRPPEGLKGSVCEGGCGDSKAELSCESDRTIVNDNFVPSQEQLEIVVSDKSLVALETKTREAEDGVKAMVDIEQNYGNSGSLTIVKSSVKSNENQGSRKKNQNRNLGAVEQQKLLSKGDSDNTKHQRKSKLPKGSGIKVKAPASNVTDRKNRKTEESTRPVVAKASGTYPSLVGNKETSAASNSSLESSKSIIPQVKRGNARKTDVDRSHVALNKVSNNNKGKIMSSSERKKSLLAQSGTIFKDDSAGSSDDEAGSENSNASTRTPSDNSLSSDYSDGDSKTPRNESYRSIRRGSGELNLSKTQSSVTLDTILRSSSRYKAAKLTASQSQVEDTETQPDEVVPDSVPNL